MTKELRKRRSKVVAVFLSSILVMQNLWLTNSYAAVNLNNEIVQSTQIQAKVICNKLNVRTGPSTTYESIGFVGKDYAFDVIAKTQSWYQVNYNDKIAYISANSKYVESTIKNEYKTLATGVILSGLNVRSGGATSYSKIGYVTKDSTVEIVKQISSGWYKIKYENTYGYISNSSKYIKLNSGNNSTPEENENNLPVIKEGKTTSTLSVRAGNSTSHELLGKLEKGSKVKIVQQMSNGWYKIKYNNSYGYVSNNYVRATLDNFLFVGDSYTYLLSNTIKSNTSGSIINAKSGCVPSYWINNFDKMPKNSSVDGVCVLLGVNGMNSIEYNTTVKDLKTLINKLSNKYTGKTVYIQKVFPLGKNYSMTTINRISKFNTEIENYCKSISNVKFIDTTAGFVDSNGYLKYPDSEGIHIVPSKYQMFFDNIGKAVLAKM